MPVQINEIVIRANIVEKPAKSESSNTSGGSSVNKEEIIKECTEIILEILKSQSER